MSQVVSFNGEKDVSLIEETLLDPGPNEVLIETISSGISAGTELTAYRGTNPYLHKHWDSSSKLFRNLKPNFQYPLVGWGYSEVGRVIELGAEVSHLAQGDVVWGIWGHRSHAVVDSKKLIGHVLREGVSADAGVFGRVGAIALNAVLASRVVSGEALAIFGQGVIGLLCTKLATIRGAKVVAIDFDDRRLEQARFLGAVETINPLNAGVDGVAGDLRTESYQEGLPSAIDISGSYKALHEAIRSVRPGGIVVGAGFYQGEGSDLRLGEEFHHNRVQLISSQIGGVPVGLEDEWTVEKLHVEFMDMVQRGELDPTELISHRFSCEDVKDAFELLDTNRDVLQVVLDFGGTK